MPRMAMAIDLNRCSGCFGCHAACKGENLTPPEITWARLEVLEVNKYPNVQRVPLPLLCMNCAEPECERVCPTGATYRRPDGIVSIDSDLCSGCKSCLVACPYGARYILTEKRTYFPGHQTPLEEVGYRRHQVGTASKCDFCAGRIDAGLAAGLTPGIDREATPACVINCWCNARVFGDLDDPESQVAKLVGSGQVIQLKAEQGTDPSVYYLVPNRRHISYLRGGAL